MLSVKVHQKCYLRWCFSHRLLWEDEGRKVFNDINLYKLYNEHAVALTSGGTEFYKLSNV